VLALCVPQQPSVMLLRALLLMWLVCGAECWPMNCSNCCGCCAPAVQEELGQTGGLLRRNLRTVPARPAVH
jgi:hypothetical protein